MLVKIKNNDSVAHVWVGQSIEAGEYYIVQSGELLRWQSDDVLLAAIADGIAIVNNGTSDITGLNNQINFLKGNTPVGNSGAPIFETGHLTGVPGSKSISIVTPNLGNRATWYQKSFKVTAGTMTDSGDGLTFTSSNANWINIYDPKLTYTHKQIPKRDGTYGKHADWAISVYVDAVLASSSTYTVNYAAGTITFGSSKAGSTVTATYWTNNGVTNPSEWLFVPPSGKKFVISCVELQYSMNMPATFDTIRFEVWGGGNLGIYSGNAAAASTVSSGGSIYPLGSSTALTTVSDSFTQPNAGATVNVTVGSTTGMSASQALYVVGGGIYVVGAVVSSTVVVLVNAGYASFSDSIYNLGFGQFRADYRNVWDIINSSNNQQSSVIPKHSDMQYDMFVAPYNYTQATVLDSAVGAMLRVCMVNDTPVADVEIATGTFYLQVY